MKGVVVRTGANVGLMVFDVSASQVNVILLLMVSLDE